MGLRHKAISITLIEHSGKTVTGNSWREVEDNLRASQWTSFHSRHEFRNEMRDRAFTWSNTVLPDFSHNSEAFIRQLVGAKLFLLEVEDA